MIENRQKLNPNWRKEHPRLDSLIENTIEELGQRDITLSQFEQDMNHNMRVGQLLVERKSLSPDNYMKYEELYYQVLSFYKKRDLRTQ